jgi:hypothetical protein
MEQVTPKPWPFDVSPDTAVVTTSYVTKDRQPILYVTHEYSEEEGVTWQFHCGNGDYDPGVLQSDFSDQRVIGTDAGSLLLRAAQRARSATVEPYFITILNSIGALWLLTNPRPAHAAGAVGAEVATLAGRTSRAARRTSAIDPCLTVVRDPIRARRRLAVSAHTHAIQTIGVSQALLARAALPA